MPVQTHPYSTLFPLPRRVRRLPGRWQRPSGALSVSITARDPRIENAVLRSDVLVRLVSDAAHAPLRMIEDHVDSRLQQLDANARHEAYRLRITPDEITLVAQRPAGLFYGWQTVRQLLQGQNAVPCMEITDWPALSFRGYHLTMGNGFMPNPQTFRSMIIRLAELKINHLVIEYDDRFPWQKHPLIPHPDAYSLDDLAGFVRLAQANFIEVIPLIDSLGHAGPYLAHKRYAHLAEGVGNRREMCPANPQTLMFIKDLWREVLAAHPQARYAHITGDETLSNNTTCSRCRGNGMAGAARNYSDYYTRLSRWMLEQGKQPMMWADMFIKIPEALRGFPRDVVMCDWYYDGHDRPDWSREDVVWRHALDGSMPGARQRLFGKYWQDRPGSKHWTAFPYTRFLQDQGFPVIGCTASAANLDPLPVASMQERFWNNKWFALKLQERDAMGMLCTHWSSRVPVEGAWPAIYAAADCSWHPRRETTDRFVRRVGHRLFDLADNQTRWLAAWDKSMTDHQDGFAPMWPQDKNIAVINRRLAAALSRGGNRGVHAELTAWAAAWQGQRQITGALCNRADELLIGHGTRVPLDLRLNANTAIADCMPSVAMPLPVPPGLHCLSGVPFRVLDDRRTNGRSALITRGARKPEGAAVIKGIPLAGKAERLFFLYTAYDAGRNCHVANINAVYEDGRRKQIPIIEGVNISDWGKGFLLKQRALMVWKGNAHYVYMSWWDNPRPEVPLLALELCAVDSRAYLILFAVTAQIKSGRRCNAGKLHALRRDWRRATASQTAHLRRLRAIYRRMTSPRDAAAAMPQTDVAPWMALYGDRIALLTSNYLH